MNAAGLQLAAGVTVRAAAESTSYLRRADLKGAYLTGADWAGRDDRKNTRIAVEMAATWHKAVTA